MTPANQKIIDFISGLNLAVLPDSVVHQAKRAVLDQLGCMIAGIDTPFGNKLHKFSRHYCDPSGSIVLGQDKSVLPVMAAMINSYLANVLDADDGHRPSGHHTGGIIIPAAFTASGQSDCSGSTFLEAILLGYEIALRAGLASRAGDTYYGSAYAGTYGAAAATGWLNHLTSDQMMNALGITEMQAPNSKLMGWINARRTPMVKEGMGWSATSGYTSVFMALEGIGGELTIFDDHRFVSRVDALGKDFEIEMLYFKFCPGCRWTHAPLQNLLSILKEHPLEASEVFEIRVRTFKNATRLDLVQPSTQEEAEYSIPYILGSALYHGKLGSKQMKIEHTKNVKIIEQAQKVKLIVDEDMDAQYPEFIKAQVEVEMKSGVIFSQENDEILGNAGYPMTDQQLEEKFEEFCSQRLTVKQIQEIISSVRNFEKLESVNRFFRQLNQQLI
jgi:2-methylcitrate dehydratase PrpD